MRAAVFQAPGQPLRIERLADPAPGEGQVVIRMERCGICGSDLHMAEGHFWPFEAGVVPGHEFAGEIVAVGRNVVDRRIGDRVTALPFLGCRRCEACLRGEPAGCSNNIPMSSAGAQGGYAELILADANWCVTLPEALNYEEGALVEPLAVSLRAIRRSGLTTGDRVLVLGAGPIGLAAIYWARRAGASRVAAYEVSPARKDMAIWHGADSFLLREDGPIGEQAAEALGGAPDIVVDCAGMPGTLDQAVAAVRRGGQVVAPGFCWGQDLFTPAAAMMKEVSILFTRIYDKHEFEISARALELGREPTAMVTSTVPLSLLPEAFETLKVPNGQCKVQIRPD